MSKSREYLLSTAMLQLERAWRPQLALDPTERGKYHDALPYPVPQFLDAIALADQVLPPDCRNFIDVGCGIGVKLLLATALGWDATGIERVPEYATAAKRFLGPASTANVLCMDALDYTNWVEHDFVFMYKPIRDDTLMLQLMTNVIQNVTPGTRLLLPMCPMPPQVRHLLVVEDEDMYERVDN